ncbi:MAG: EpsI family protein [Sphingomonadaceae bacterium]|nr:EpsI family protein [Sphingomonadaceae bacterium]
MTPGSGWSWHSPGPSIAGGKSEILRGDNGDLRLALTWYRTGSLLTGSNARLKLGNMADRLLLRARPTAMLIVSSVDRNGVTAEDDIRGFLHDAGPVDQWMDRFGGVR